MPQFPQQRRSRFGVADGGAVADATDADGSGVLAFAPDLVARTIVFHMLDEGLAREVTEESVRAMVARLRRRGLRPAIRRSAWEVMTNHDRLEWLLAETLTVPLMRPEDDVVTLESRDDRDRGA